MDLDIRTLAFTAGLIATMSAFALSLLWYIARRIEGVGYWAVSHLFLSASLVMIALRGQVHDFISIGVANALLLISAAISWYGHRKFFRQPDPTFWGPVIIAGCVIAGLVMGTILTGDITARFVLSSITSGFLYFLVAMVPLRNAGPNSVTPRVVGGIILLHAAFMLSRPFLFLGMDPSTGIMQSGLGGQITYLEGIVMIVGATMGYTLLAAERLQEDLNQQARHDPLTNVLNRRAFLQLAEREMARATRRKTPISILIMDLDRFKELNDTYGHPVGDIVLSRTARLLNDQLRAQDIFARYGGEEFIALLPDTDKAGAIITAERLRTVLEKSLINTGRQSLSITTSIGAASSAHGSEILGELIATADLALYEAKRTGRNRTVAADSGEDLIGSEYQLSSAGE